jgi:cbb3-type cytochrome oxidase maturation protein
MKIIFLLVPIALLLGGSFLAAFLIFSARGEYEDLETPAHRILLEDDE